ncbi:MAG TPA: transcription antitermination factor NusB [Streptosporangiaceae bacterium]
MAGSAGRGRPAHGDPARGPAQGDPPRGPAQGDPPRWAAHGDPPPGPAPGGPARRPSHGNQARRPAHGDPARRAVCDVLLAVAKRDAYANLLLPSILRERQLTGRDAALATELCYGTLRGQGTYDAILAVCSDRRVTRMDPPVREVLRMGVHQLLATRVAAHAAVATSVDLAKDVAGMRTAGFVNAVLRRVSMRDLEAWMTVVAPDRQADPAGYLAARHSYPRWIVAAFSEALGEAPGSDLAETEAALAAGNVGPRVTLCAIPGVCDPAELAAAAPGEPARWSPFGVYLTEGDPAAIAALRERRAAVQDEASQLAALALTRAEVSASGRPRSVGPGSGELGFARRGSGESGSGVPGSSELWLDMCAGPGGKAGLLAGLAAGRGARLLAADARERRAGMARDAVAGPGLTAAAGTAPGTVVADGTKPAWRRGVFDRVLADVPCCGLGSLRRRPEARWRRSPGQVAELAQLQRSLLATALDSVRPGGVVGYVTCSPHLAETREVLADVLAGRQDISVIDAPALLPEVPAVASPAPYGSYVQFWPHRHGTDAIFLALLRKEG